MYRATELFDRIVKCLSHVYLHVKAQSVLYLISLYALRFVRHLPAEVLVTASLATLLQSVPLSNKSLVHTELGKTGFKYAFGKRGEVKKGDSSEKEQFSSIGKLVVLALTGFPE